MQPTLIKVKFIPLIKQLKTDGTKCCLEIVPDVSYIQNLDKIEWIEEDTLIEYSVPITYKIILKKNIAHDNEDKIYYSCIDLRHYTNSSLGCGDIKNVASDIFTLNKPTTDFNQSAIFTEPYKLNKEVMEKSVRFKEDIRIEKNNVLCIDTNILKPFRIFEDVNETCLTPKSFGKGAENVRAIEYTTTNDQSRVNFTDNNKQLRQISTERTESKETVSDISEIKTSKKKRRKLTISSVCTLNTIDFPGDCKESLKCNSQIYVNYELTYNSDNNIIYDTEHHGSQRKTTKRILPEMRVAYFMMAVENEILPLKIMLNELYEKCASLGLLRKPNLLQSLHPNNNFVNTFQNIPKCNRVLYSVVFQE